jgi:hypothetical protein
MAAWTPPYILSSALLQDNCLYFDPGIFSTHGNRLGKEAG